MSEMTLEQARAMVAEAEKKEREAEEAKYCPKGATVVIRNGKGYSIAHEISGQNIFPKKDWTTLNAEEMAGFNLLMERALRREGK